MCAPGPFVLRSITLLRLLLAALALVHPLFTASTEKLDWQNSRASEPVTAKHLELVAALEGQRQKTKAANKPSLGSHRMVSAQEGRRRATRPRLTGTV